MSAIFELLACPERDAEREDAGEGDEGTPTGLAWIDDEARQDQRCPRCQADPRRGGDLADRMRRRCDRGIDHRGARAEEGVCFVEGVSDEVEDRDVEGAEAALEHHEAHLGGAWSRPGSP